MRRIPEIRLLTDAIRNTRARASPPHSAPAASRARGRRASTRRPRRGLDVARAGDLEPAFGRADRGPNARGGLARDDGGGAARARGGRAGETRAGRRVGNDRARARDAASSRGARGGGTGTRDGGRGSTRRRARAIGRRAGCTARRRRLVLSRSARASSGWRRRDRGRNC